MRLFSFVRGALVVAAVLLSEVTVAQPQQIRFATFNVSMEASNYRKDPSHPLDANALSKRLMAGNYPQISNVAEIIQRVRPDVLLLNEFDYLANNKLGIDAFRQRYLAVGHNGADPIDYPYAYVAPVNTGIPSPFDIDGDGVASGTGADAYGFGFYPGQYGMAVLSKFPIVAEQVRTFQKLLWHRMPNHQRIVSSDGADFYDATTWRGLRLSSKSHWDLPIQIDEAVVHLLAAHPTPPVFDGAEDRNGARNYDEIRLWADYIGQPELDYLVDDDGKQGGLKQGSRFVIMGDYNASPNEGNSRAGAIEQLLEHPLVNATVIPQSEGAKQHTPQNRFASFHTAAWRAQVDYVLPSKHGLTPISGGVFWPVATDPLRRLIAGRKASSDHRLVWLDVTLEPKPQ